VLRANVITQTVDLFHQRNVVVDVHVSEFLLQLLELRRLVRGGFVVLFFDQVFTSVVGNGFGGEECKFHFVVLRGDGGCGRFVHSRFVRRHVDARLHRHQERIGVHASDPFFGGESGFGGGSVGVEVFVELVALSRDDHGDRFADAFDGVQLVEAEDFTVVDVQAALRHETEASLKWRYVQNKIIKRKSTFLVSFFFVNPMDSYFLSSSTVFIEIFKTINLSTATHAHKNINTFSGTTLLSSAN
jgi:hypothetical protein